MLKYIKGDIHDVIDTFEPKSIDLIYTNPPFGTTHYAWDTKLNWNVLFPKMFNALKKDGNIVLHCSIPFTYELIQTRIPKYHFTWKKSNGTNYTSCKHQPLRDVEEILVYYNQRTKGKHEGKYNPVMQGDKPVRYSTRPYPQYMGQSQNPDREEKEPHYGRYPRTFLGSFKQTGIPGAKTVPKEIISKLIRMYSNEGDVVLDMTCHNTYVGKICQELGRRYIGVDIRDIQGLDGTEDYKQYERRWL